jgi:hypothetical protein
LSVRSAVHRAKLVVILEHYLHHVFTLRFLCVTTYRCEC